jgi:hypothetical protein
VFQHYSSGVFADEGCGEKLDHGVLVVGLTADAYIVKVRCVHRDEPLLCVTSVTRVTRVTHGLMRALVTRALV